MFKRFNSGFIRRRTEFTGQTICCDLCQGFLLNQTQNDIQISLNRSVSFGMGEYGYDSMEFEFEYQFRYPGWNELVRKFKQ